MTENRPRTSARELIEAVVDPGSWQCWDEPVEVTTDDPAYRADLLAARERTGLDESVVTGEGRIRGRRVALVACEFRFLAGSIGVDAGERLVRAVERATAERLPLLAAPASGGTRMQEGTIAFLQMVKVAAAITDHKAAGLPYLVHLRHPTTGGVLASWGSLGHLTSAEPGALIGFLGPRVHEALYGEEFPQGVQLAENLLAHGLVDGVLPAERLAEVAARALAVLCRDADGGADADMDAGPALVRPSGGTSGAPDVPAAESIRRSRRPDRPGVAELLAAAATEVTPLSGTGAGEHDPGLLLALARVGGTPCVVLGHDRGSHSTPASGVPAAGQALGPAGLRAARRGMRVAAELDLPLLTVVDTAGAALSRDAEEGGLAGEIARCLADLVTLSAPTLCLLLGQGAGGAALALLPADRVVAARHAWLSPLPPEGASAILYRTTERAFEVAARQGVRSADLLAHDIVDLIVEEEADGEAAGAFLPRLGALLGTELAALSARDRDERLAARRARYRRIGLNG
ncbi:carboxyl transferase domain-containing protein [Streptomyces albireticuli]|uniref:Acetyl-CoA carboxyl transferase n=1 Tax=Streptomyces albireticuli TaxID=1940 RepID=A0A2A2D0J2_9ACTN|nr:carboxyl transferase domain-containing protein [Streptomyces albireticuli]MCD9143507.1 acetyl-CoA carboxylase carboxyltransferase subunit alpha/beta [Streptomyces albireticuli]MCD9164866.1 acetyl-CoA carboxylase carboxyltransferase subunit alpha/beta [Streptomyces albireticuli]MCD9191624.1 acetyl-CoA carboxylase carboxyltransferase subunit alpha/beta [Streptomyces albireticuli]PAU44936.1 acetyl-CoA carboxyl transferase [Streptomyces albireticuli]